MLARSRNSLNASEFSCLSYRHLSDRELLDIVRRQNEAYARAWEALALSQSEAVDPEPVPFEGDDTRPWEG